MLARFAFLIAMCLGLALAPVRPAGACQMVSSETSCERCCATLETACCELSGSSQTPALPAKTSPSSPDAKQLVQPALPLLGLTPPPAAEPPSVHRQHAARIPALPLIEKTCIRLI